MRNNDAQSLAFSLLAASRALVDGVSAGVSARGFGDVRPAHGLPSPGFQREAPPSPSWLSTWT